jgi:hypothetical protein
VDGWLLMDGDPRTSVFLAVYSQLGEREGMARLEPVESHRRHKSDSPVGFLLCIENSA